jgi:hypothetical protein
MVKKRTSSFSFKGKTSTRAERDKKEGSSYGYLLLQKNVSVYNPEAGKSVKLDFIPYIVTDPKHPDRDDENGIAQEGDPWYRKVYWRHTNIGADPTAYVCLKSIGKKCPICEHLAKRKKNGADEEETNALKASKRVLYVVIPLDSEKYEKKLHVMDFSYFNFQNLLDDELRENDEQSIFPNLVEGETLKVRFASKTIADSKPFPQASRIDFIARKTDYEESILEEAPNLDEMLKVLSYKELQAKLFEMDIEDADETLDNEEEEEEDDVPVRKGKSVKKKVVEEEEEEEEEEDEAPRKKSSKVVERKTLVSARRKHVEDDEEEEDEEDKPVKKGSSKKTKCPYGHKFGIDHEEYDDCEDCAKWDECLEAKEG